MAFQKDACNCNESFQTGGREGGRAAGEGWGRVVRKNRGARCKEMWENDGETRAAYWDARRRGSTVECVSADGDVAVKVRSEGGEFKHN